jgi:arylsulfatase A-like enzyme
LAAAAVLAAASLLASDPVFAVRPSADNILLVSFDTTRADRLSAYGYEHETSPALRRLASKGALFEQAFTHVPSTLPAHSTLMTGRLPAAHGVRCNGKFALPAGETTLAEILKAAGFATGAVIGGFPLDSRFGIAQGFDHYDDDFVDPGRRETDAPRAPESEFWIGHEHTVFERPAADVAERAIRWLSTVQGRWFLFAHFFDPHTPYRPARGVGDKLSDPYDAEIANMDEAFGRLIDFASGLEGRTLIVVTADHGEGLGDHGEKYHNRYLYDATLRVPLVVVHEGAVPPGTRVRQNVGHVDVLPTVLELAGLPSPPSLGGRSLVPALAGRPLPDRPLLAETLVWSLERPDGIEVRALIEGSEKFVRTDRRGETVRRELYDRSEDPGELADVAERRSGRTEELDARLTAVLRESATGAPPLEPFEFDDETKARLRSLGYL